MDRQHISTAELVGRLGRERRPGAEPNEHLVELADDDPRVAEREARGEQAHHLLVERVFVTMQRPHGVAREPVGAVGAGVSRIGENCTVDTQFRCVPVALSLVRRAPSRARPGV